MPDSAHYFDRDPAVPEQRRTITVRLAGRDTDVETAPGVFSPGHVDLGTRVLLRTVGDRDLAGDVLDLGCGWGPLALSMAMRSPAATVWGLDVNARALDLLRDNAARLGLRGIRPVTPEQVPAELTFTAIWSNPPIRIGKEALHALLERWLSRLTDDGVAHLVVQRHLGADSLQRWITESLCMPARRVASAKGFRVLEVAR